MYNIKVLFVDDEDAVREEFGLFLKRKGYEVVTAADGLQAFRLFRREEPDIVLTDFHMPEITGLELLKEIKAIRPEVPVILISGKADMRTAVEALKEDAFDFLQKPVDSTDLLRSVQKALSRKKEAGADGQAAATSGSQNSADSSKYYGPINHSIEGPESNVSVLNVYRALDEYAKKSLSDTFSRLLAEQVLKTNVLFVLKNVHYINNVGLNFLIESHATLKSRGHSVILSHLSDPVYKYLKMLGYIDYFKVIPNTQDAINQFQYSTR
ncbi:MAG: response regulator [bacterium]|nr:response regulator [bacterium]